LKAPKRLFHAFNPNGVKLVNPLLPVGRSTIHSIELPTRVVPDGGFLASCADCLVVVLYMLSVG